MAKCEWVTDVEGINWHTECGHTYFPFIRDFNQPKIIDDTCPWCGKKIDYNEEGYND